MEDDFHAWLTNHWPTLVAKVANLEGLVEGMRGQQKMLMTGVGLLIALAIVLIGLAVKG